MASIHNKMIKKSGCLIPINIPYTRYACQKWQDQEKILGNSEIVKHSNQNVYGEYAWMRYGKISTIQFATVSAHPITNAIYKALSLQILFYYICFHLLFSLLHTLQPDISNYPVFSCSDILFIHEYCIQKLYIS